jgi:hypothetical protein
MEMWEAFNAVGECGGVGGLSFDVRRSAFGVGGEGELRF